MDVTKLIRNIVNLDKYIQLSHEVASNFKNCTVEFNMSTILFLKKMRTFEVEFFNKYGNNGAAIKIFELILLLPPSQTWHLLGKDLISLLQFWLSSLRNQLISKNTNWWSYLCTLLQFIMEIRLKDKKLNNILVEETADIILSLATHDIPNISQKHKILCVFNLCGAECSREIRFAMRTQFEYYFITLAELLATCGDVAFQYSIMETLLRWLLPRHDNNLRSEAAAKWFPSYLYEREVVNVFLERSWQNFFQDARDFLNMHNESNNLITSVIIKKLIVGNIALITGLESRLNWLDINGGTKCLSVILDPSMVKLLGSKCEATTCETLVISEVNTKEAKLQRQSLDLVLSVRTIEPPHFVPSSVSLTDEDQKHLEITICSKSNLARVDKALQKIFADKFQDDDKLFPRPGQLKRGCKVKSKNTRPDLTPSSTSTSSLAQLQEKLAALPKIDRRNKPVTICAYPELSNVAEDTETEDHNSFNASTSTFKNRYYGVCQKNIIFDKNIEVNGEGENQTNNIKRRSPFETEKERPVSCLLVATIGSADESIINDTLERLSKSKDCTADNVLDLLVQEAIQNKLQANENIESEIKESVNEDNFLKEKLIDKNKADAASKCTVISNSTSAEESNTDIVEGTQLSHVNFEKRSHRHKKNILTNNQLGDYSPVKSFDEKAVEEFFSQHFIENRSGEIIISPSLARKINETSSESSEDFAECCFDENMDKEVVPDIYVVECLKCIIDKICNEFDHCDKTLNKDLVTTCTVGDLEENNLPEEINGNELEPFKQVNEKCPVVVSKKSSVKPVTLKFKATNKSTRGKIIKKKIEAKESTIKTPVNRKSIIKKNSSKNKVNVVDTVKLEKPKASEERTSLVRRKRKLYSPKAQHWNDDENVIEVVPDHEQTTKTNSDNTCYREIEKVRNDYMKKLRNRNPKKQNPLPLSPRTKKNNELFDKLKEQTVSNEKIVFADRTNTQNDLGIYNFSSDSESDDFKDSKAKPIASSSINNTVVTTDKNKPKSKRTCPARRINQPKSKTRSEKPVKTVVDERMREQPTDILNTSLKIQKPPQKRVRDSFLNLKIEHKMEVMKEDLNRSVENISKTKGNKKKCKPKNTNVSNILNETSDRTLSPLPGLVVETVPQVIENSNDSLTRTKFNKLKKICETRKPIESGLNTTQTLLSDHEDRIETIELNHSPINYIATSWQSPQKEKSSLINNTTEKRTKKHSKSYENSKKIESSNSIRNMEDSNNELLNLSRLSKKDEERSIKTVGYSPITAHGDLNLCCHDSPPRREFLDQSIEPRNLEIDGLNQSIKEFFIQLNKEIVEEPAKGDSDVGSNGSTPRNVNLTKFGVKTEGRLKSPNLSLIGTKELTTNSRSSSDVNIDICYSRESKDKAKDKIKKMYKGTERSPQKRLLPISQISPVKLFDDLKPVPRRDSITSKSSDDDDEKHYENMFYKKKPTPQIVSPRSGRYWLRINRDKDSSIESTVSTSTKKSSVKRKSTDKSSQNSKKRRLEEVDVCRKISDSRSSGSRLNDWFRSMNPSTSKGATLDGVFNENMSYIIEKLDTTVNEIHHNTDKRFINMFVEAQSQLEANKELRNALYKTTARELITDMITLIDARFADMNAKSEELDRKFMAELKERAREIITDDCRKKKALVRLLREDVQAVRDFMNKEK